MKTVSVGERSLNYFYMCCATTNRTFTVRLCKMIWSGEDGEAAAVSVTVGLADSVSGRL